jgi:hypothetical protein
MTNDRRRDPPLAAMEEQDPGLAHELHALVHLSPRDQQFKYDMRERLLAHAHTIASTRVRRDGSMASMASTISGSRRARTHGRHGSLRGLRVAIAAALVLAVSAVAAYVQVQPVEPVSAQSVLRHAVAAMSAVSPDQVIHETSRYEGLNLGALTGQQTRASSTVTIDQWTQLTATGAISRQATTAASPTGAVLFRELQMGRNAQLYATASNSVQIGAIPKGQGASWIDNPLGITDLRAFLRAVQQGALPNIRLLPRATLNGVSVDVIQNRIIEPLPPGAPAGLQPAQDVYTLYLDARSYALRGLDQLWIDSHAKIHVSTRVRVMQRQLVSITAVPAGTFALHAPASARVIASQFKLVSVANAVSQPDRPAPLLAGDPLGLQLQYISVDKLQGYDRFTYWYKAGTPTFGQYDRRKSVIVELFHYVPPTTSAQSGRLPTRQITVRIAGATVHASYLSIRTDNAGLTHSLYYHQGTVAVSIDATDMTDKHFFVIVNAFVDGHTHPTDVTRLQGEIDAP